MELQETRRHILEILREKTACTVEEIGEALSERLGKKFTTVTVRHHLERLRAEDLVKPPQVLRRNSPGRPQYLYELSAHALDYFPSNYASLASNLLQQIKKALPGDQVNVILEGVAGEMAAAANIPPGSIEERLDHVVQYLSQHGYDAHWQATDGGYLLTTTNCPYASITDEHAELCGMDLRLMASMLGTVPRLKSTVLKGNVDCQYFIPAPSA